MSSTNLTQQKISTATNTQSGLVSTTQQTFAGNKSFNDGLKTNEIQANTASTINIKNSSGTTTTSISETGNLSVLNNIQQNGNNIISWVEVTPYYLEWSFSGSVTSQSINLTTAIPANTRYILADVFATSTVVPGQTYGDHQNFVLSRTALTNQYSWVNSRGQQPSATFGSGLARQAVLLTYSGESDGYSPYYGIWYPSQNIPVDGRTMYFGNYGNSGSSGWLYIIIKAYSI
jgi:uncharacterized protein YfiM (DUF2279 family)